MRTFGFTVARGSPSFGAARLLYQGGKRSRTMATTASPRQVEEVVDEGAAFNEDLEATSAKLEAMSSELDALLASLEGDVPGEVLATFNEEELEREGLAAAGGGGADDDGVGDAPATYESLKKRKDDVASAIDNELKITEELRALQKELEADNAQRADDCRRAMAELNELRDAMDAMTSAPSECEAELNALRAKKHGHEETKAEDAPPPPPPPPGDGPRLHPDDAQLEADATPTDEEAQMMIMLLAKMKYQALGVENAQLAAQIADLEAMRKSEGVDLQKAMGVLDRGGSPNMPPPPPPAETSAE